MRSKTFLGILCALFCGGCVKDYSPTLEYEKTPSTLTVDEEDRLIDDGETLLDELDFGDIDDIPKVTKSLGQLQNEKKIATESKKSEADEIPQEPWIEVGRLPWERWEVYYQRSKPVGYSTQVIRKSSAGGEERLVIESKTSMESTVGEQKVQSISELLIVESANGELKSIDGSLKQGGAVSKINVVAAADIVRVTITNNGQNKVQTIVRDKRLRGPFAVEESLLLKPMSIGERRRLLTFQPALSEVVNVELVARGLSRVPVATGETLDLLEIEQVVEHGKQKLLSTLWVDDQGNIRKRYLGQNGFTSHAVNESLAIAVRNNLALKSFAKTTLTLPKPIESNAEQDSLMFRATSSVSDPFKIFSSSTGQLVRSNSPVSCDIEVRRKAARDLLLRESITGTVGKEYLLPSLFLDFQERSVQEIRDKYSQLNTEEPIVLRMARGMHTDWTFGEFAYDVYPASQTAIRKSTDCFNAAILLASLCRAVEIPACVVTGLTYNDDPTAPGMRFHAWVEVYHNSQWLPVDCTRSDLQVPLATLRIAETPLSDQNPLSVVLPVFEAIEKVELSLR